MGNFSIGDYSFEYGIQKGKVLHVDEKLETVVSGGGGGYVANGQGKSSISISSSTITHTNIFLEGVDGKQFSVKLKNWDISCMSSHEMVFITLQTAKVDNRYVLIHNKTLDKTYTAHNFNDYIKHLDEAVVKLGCLLYLGLLIGLPTLAYGATQSYVAGTFGFVVAIILTAMKFKKWGVKQKKERTETEQIKSKLNELLEREK